MINPRRQIPVALAVAVALGGCVTRPVPLPSIGLSLPPASLVPIEKPSKPRPWALAGLGDIVLSTSLGDVLATDDGFVIVGGSGPDRDVPIALHSTDGVAWTEEPITAQPGMRPYQLASWGDRVVALGGGSTPGCSGSFALDL